MMKVSILFGIVCFREKFWETESFKDLLRSYRNYDEDCQLFLSVYDNTDYNDWDIMQFFPHHENISINYHRDSLNSGIAAAFNHFAELANKQNLEWVVFLDQDTRLPNDFFSIYSEKISTTDKQILFPKIYVGDNLFSPSYYKWYRTFKIKNILPEIILNNVTAINSGMLIKTDFYLSNGGYNKNLRIDFCDHDFIERINNRNLSADIINICLYQEFSFKINNKEKSLERYNLFIKDLKVYRKNKNLLLVFFLVDLPHLLKEIFRNKSLKFLKIRLKK